MHKLATLAILIAATLAISGCIQFGPAPSEQPEQPEGFQSQYSIATQNIRTPHFVNSAPAHGEVWATVPNEIVINTNFDIVSPSFIKITKDGVDVTDGDIQISEERLTMRVPVKKGSGNGEYVVNYHACWPDRTCHDGSFGFIVDSAFVGQMTDLTGQASVTVNLENISFSPRYIRISRGTEVTFVNGDDVEHFINTDPHPSHNYAPELNSRGFFQGDSVKFTFDETGEIHYHCSAHESLGMDAIILVE